MALVEQSSDFIGMGDALGNALYINEAGQQMLGLPGPEQVRRAHLMDFFMPEDRPFVQEGSIPAVMSQGRWEGEFRFRHFQTGQPIPAHYNVFALKEKGSDEVKGIATVSRDIRARKAVDAVLALHARHGRLMAAVGLALTHAPHRKDMLQRCMDAMVEHLDAASARVWLVDEVSSQTLVLEASAGLESHRDGPHGRVPFGQHEIGHIAQLRQPYLTNAVTQDEWVSDPVWARLEGLVAFAGYPLLVADTLVGVVAVFARQPLPLETLEALKQAADSMALGVQRLRAEEARAQLLQSEQAARAEAERANRLKDEFLATVATSCARRSPRCWAGCRCCAPGAAAGRARSARWRPSSATRAPRRSSSRTCWTCPASSAASCGSSCEPVELGDVVRGGARVGAARGGGQGHAAAAGAGLGRGRCIGRRRAGCSRWCGTCCPTR